MLRLALLCAGCFQVNLLFTCTNSEQCVMETENGLIQGVCTADHICYFESGTDLAGVGDLSGVDFSGVDFAQAPVDLAGVDFAGADLSQPTAQDLAGADLELPVCDYPQLLVTVENLDTPGPGKLLRYHIPPSGPVVACHTLNGSGALGQLPQAAAKVGNDIAVAARDGVYLIDPTNDIVTARWDNNPNVLFPIDVAPLSTGEGLEIAVAWEQVGSPPWLWQLDLFLPSEPTTAKHSWLASNLALGSVIGMTIDPWDPTKLMVLDDYSSPSTPQAEEYVDPLAPSVVGHMDEPNGLGMRTIASISVGGIERTVWAATNLYNGFYMLNAAAPSPKPTVPSFGPGQCSCDML